MFESLEEVRAASASGKRVKYLFFWNDKPPRGEVGPGCLSQWWPSKFTVDGNLFGSAEHYMMYRKAMLFDDHDSAEQILHVKHPGAVKQLGRQVRGFDEQRWREHRFGIVVDGNRAKFTQDQRLREYLRGTAKRVLVEASPIDRVWGIGLAADDPRADRPRQWRGLNLLGFALMRVREDFG